MDTPSLYEKAVHRLRGAQNAFLASQVAVLDLARMSESEAARLDFPEARAARLAETLGHPELELEKAMAILTAAESLLDSARVRREKKEAGEPTAPASADATAGASNSSAEAGESHEEEAVEGEELQAAIREAGLPDRAVVSAIRFVARVRAEKPRHPLMLESLLLSAVAQFEVFVSRVIKTSLMADPKPLMQSDATYSFKDVVADRTMEGFLTTVANQYVDALMYKGMDEWMKFLQRATRSETEWVTDLLAEVIMRRNVHVHAGGRASQQYLEKLGKAAAAVKLNQELPVTPDYLEDALDRMARVAIVLSQAGIAAVCAAAKEDKRRTHDISQDGGIVNASYDLLAAGRHRAAKDLWPHLDKFVAKNSTRERLRANSYAARKALNGLDDVAAEIVEWDVSAAEDEIRLAKHCLLEDVDAARSIYDALEARGDITLFELATWPILEPLRRANAERGESDDSPPLEAEE